MAPTHKNKFTSEARHRLLDLNLSITSLAKQLKRPRETVSKAIHSNRFPLVRAKVAKKLGLHLNQDAA
jgi:hypothetical protein